MTTTIFHRRVNLSHLSTLLIALVIPSVALTATQETSAAIENDILRVSLNPLDASLTVLDKRDGHSWRQQALPGFRAADVHSAATTINATVNGDGGPYTITIKISAEVANGFDLSVDVPAAKYATLPPVSFSLHDA